MEADSDIKHERADLLKGKRYRKEKQRSEAHRNSIYENISTTWHNLQFILPVFLACCDFASGAAKFNFNMRLTRPSASFLILMDVKQLGHFIQVRVFLSIFNDLRGAELKRKIQMKQKWHFLPLRNSEHEEKGVLPTFLAMGILLNTFHRMMPTTTLSLR